MVRDSGSPTSPFLLPAGAEFETGPSAWARYPVEPGILEAVTRVSGGDAGAPARAVAALTADPHRRRHVAEHVCSSPSGRLSSPDHARTLGRWQPASRTWSSSCRRTTPPTTTSARCAPGARTSPPAGPRSPTRPPGISRTTGRLRPLAARPASRHPHATAPPAADGHIGTGRTGPAPGRRHPAPAQRPTRPLTHSAAPHPAEVGCAPDTPPAHHCVRPRAAGPGDGACLHAGLLAEGCHDPADPRRCPGRGSPTAGGLRAQRGPTPYPSG
jgi:hypothetical protein